MKKFSFNEPLTLKIPYPCDDGGTLYRDFEAAMISIPEVSYEVSGCRLRNDSVLLISSKTPPAPGALAVAANRTWEIVSVKTCRDLDGNVVAYRCLVK